MDQRNNKRRHESGKDDGYSSQSTAALVKLMRTQPGVRIETTESGSTLYGPGVITEQSPENNEPLQSTPGEATDTTLDSTSSTVKMPPLTIDSSAKCCVCESGLQGKKFFIMHCKYFVHESCEVQSSSAPRAIEDLVAWLKSQPGTQIRKNSEPSFTLYGPGITNQSPSADSPKRCCACQLSVSGNNFFIINCQHYMHETCEVASRSAPRLIEDIIAWLKGQPGEQIRNTGTGYSPPRCTPGEGKSTENDADATITFTSEAWQIPPPQWTGILSCLEHRAHDACAEKLDDPKTCPECTREIDWENMFK